MQNVNSNIIASIKGIHKKFDNKLALNNVEFDIKANQVLAILGSNGAGKTTLINMLLGRLTPDSGRISVFSSDAGSQNAKQKTGAMLQVASLPDTLKVKEHIELFRSYYPTPMAYQKIIAYAGLEHIENRYSKKLSGGEKQRLLFALSLCGNPKLLFLDEPTVGMDITARQKLWQTIRDLKAAGTAIVLTTHYLEEADSLADEVILLKQGSVIEKGSNEKIKSCVSSTTIQFITPATPFKVANITGVISYDQYGKYTKLQSNQGNQTLIELLTIKPDLKELTVTRAGLEEAFLQLDKNVTKNVKDAA
ncbi:ABC transporter ATP-binding protein [Algibacillus agarilyticus]|uniref:ABC transporter ATP-binding protein n=1 Tax=Algibacillus agarilyticus TaxID=2234133 RepID=UPI000DD0278E|nr:ABC transporter ATP-binding protein [Algibacillus agarilyticus]